MSNSSEETSHSPVVSPASYVSTGSGQTEKLNVEELSKKLADLETKHEKELAEKDHEMKKALDEKDREISQLKAQLSRKRRHQLENDDEEGPSAPKERVVVNPAVQSDSTSLDAPSTSKH